jgi:hypothetical protein
MINSHVKFLQLNIAQTGIVKDANWCAENHKTEEKKNHKI